MISFSLGFYTKVNQAVFKAATASFRVDAVRDHFIVVIVGTGAVLIGIYRVWEHFAQMNEESHRNEVNIWIGRHSRLEKDCNKYFRKFMQN